MLLAGALFVCWPLYRNEARLTPALALAAVGVLALTGTLYSLIGSPGAPSGRGAVPSVDEMVLSLAERLKRNPQDADGWKMLGRSYVQLRRYDDAVPAFERALELEGGSDAQTLADLAEAVMLTQGGSVAGRPSQLFEAALAAAPANSKALFYGGIAAIERGEAALAADRWESLLALSPPPEIQEILRQRIAEWRGEPPPAAAAPAANAGAAVVSVDVSLNDAATTAVPADATVFIIARDPVQPSPPIAVARRKASELPATVELGDANAMVPGRVPSQFSRLEIVARASLSGGPMASPGDWYGSAEIDTTTGRTLAITIDRKVGDTAPR